MSLEIIFLISVVVIILGIVLFIISIAIQANLDYTKKIIEKDMKKCDKNNCNYGKDSCVLQNKTKCSKDTDCSDLPGGSGLTGACDVNLGNCIKQNYMCFKKIYDSPKTYEAMDILSYVCMALVGIGVILAIVSAVIIKGRSFK